MRNAKKELVSGDDSKSQTIARIRQELKRKYKAKSMGTVLYDISQKPDDINDSERQFAVEYALLPRSVEYWAKRRGCPSIRIWDMLTKPGVQMIIREIQSNIMQRLAAARTAVIAGTMQFYLETLALPPTPENQEFKRLVCQDIAKFIDGPRRAATPSLPANPETPQLPPAPADTTKDITMTPSVPVTYEYIAGTLQPDGKILKGVTKEELDNTMKELKEMIQINAGSK